jgi:DNA repair exonuclease SbcCD ATPase subunit
VNELRFKLESQKEKRKQIIEKLRQKEGEKERIGKAREEWRDKTVLAEESAQKWQSMKGRLGALETRLHSFSLTDPEWDQKGIDFIVSEKRSAATQIRMLQAQQEQHRLLDVQHQKALQRVELIERRKKEWEERTNGLSLSSVEAQIRELSQQKKQLSDRFSKIQSDWTECVSIIRFSDTQLGEIAKEAAALESLHANCPTCRQEIRPEHKEAILVGVGEKKKFIGATRAEAEASRQRLQSERLGIEAALHALERLILEQESLRVRIMDGESLYRELEKTKGEWEKAQSALNAMGVVVSESEIEKLRQYSIQLGKREEMAIVKEEFSKMKREAEEEGKHLVSLGNPRVEWDKLNTEWASFESEWNALDREKELLSQVEQELSARVSSVQKLQKQRDDISSTLSYYGEVEEGLGIFSNALVETQQQLREGVVEAINAALGELWPSLYPYQDFTLAKVLVQDNDYVLTVKERSGSWISAESSLSGGERSAAALALRMAIAFVLTRQLSWIILDEPTHNLDAKSIQMLSSMLKTRLPGLVDQVFVITHSPEIEKSATGSLYVLEREKNEDGITIPVNKMIDLGTKIE